MNETMNQGAYCDAQQALIGSMLIEPKAVPIVMSEIREEDFSLPEIRTLFNSIRELWMAAKPVDPVTVLDLAGNAHRETVRGCMAATPTAANVKAHCRIVQDGAAFFRIREVAESILDARNLPEAAALLAEAENLAAGNREVRAVTIQEALQNAYLRAMNTKGDWIDWGLSKLTEVLQIPRGKFVVLAADSSVGKTALALQLAWNIGRKRRVVFYSIETDDDTLGDRTVAQRVGIDLGKLQRRKVEDGQWKEWLEMNKYAGRVDLTLVNAAGMNLQQIRADIITRQAEVAFIDYVQMLDAPGRDTADTVRAVSLSLHKMSQDLRCTIVGLSQLTVPPDAPDKWVPKMEHLRESRQLKNDADAVLMLYLHKRSQRDGGRWLAVAKNKEGTLGRIYLKYDGPHLFFVQADPPVEKEKNQRDELPDPPEEKGPFRQIDDCELSRKDQEVLDGFASGRHPDR